MALAYRDGRTRTKHESLSVRNITRTVVDDPYNGINHTPFDWCVASGGLGWQAGGRAGVIYLRIYGTTHEKVNGWDTHKSNFNAFPHPFMAFLL